MKKQREEYLTDKEAFPLLDLLMSDFTRLYRMADLSPRRAKIAAGVALMLVCDSGAYAQRALEAIDALVRKE